MKFTTLLVFLCIIFSYARDYKPEKENSPPAVAEAPSNASKPEKSPSKCSAKKLPVNLKNLEKKTKKLFQFTQRKRIRIIRKILHIIVVKHDTDYDLCVKEMTRKKNIKNVEILWGNLHRAIKFKKKIIPKKVFDLFIDNDYTTLEEIPQFVHHTEKLKTMTCKEIFQSKMISEEELLKKAKQEEIKRLLFPGLKLPEVRLRMRTIDPFNSIHRGKSLVKGKKYWRFLNKHS